MKIGMFLTMMVFSGACFGQTAAHDNKVQESVTFKQPLTGAGVFGIFEGRTPSEPINKLLRGGVPSSLDHLKWQLILFKDSISGKPTTYQLSTEMFNRKLLTGKWRVIGKYVVLERERPLYLLKGDENVLFILDFNKHFLVGDQDFSYTLNRVHKVLQKMAN